MSMQVGEWYDEEENEGAAIVPKADIKVLDYLGTLERRKALEVVAASLSIPAEAFDYDQELTGKLAIAVKWIGQGYTPGYHFFAISFRSEIDGNWRDVFQIIPGEKMFKLSAAELGIEYVFQDRRMTNEEVAKYAKSVGFSGAINDFSAGYWSRVITNRDVEFDVKLGGNFITSESPAWHAGVWFGQKKAGRKWAVDYLPVGVDGANVAIRRAHLHALRASGVPIVTISGRSEEERLRQLADDIRAELEATKRESAPLAEKRPRVEDDGDILFEGEEIDVSDAVLDGAEMAVPQEAQPEPNKAHAEAVRLLNSLGRLAYGDEWKKAKDEILRNNEVVSSVELSDEQIETEVSVIGDALVEEFREAFGDEVNEAVWIATAGEYNDIGEVPYDWTLYYTAKELRNMQGDEK